MNGANMLLSDFPAFGAGGDTEVSDLMERIYQHYCLKLEEKAGLRRKIQKKKVVFYGSK